MNLSLLLRLAYGVCQQRERRQKKIKSIRTGAGENMSFFIVFSCQCFDVVYSSGNFHFSDSKRESLILQREILLETVVEQLFVELIYALCLCA